MSVDELSPWTKPIDTWNEIEVRLIDYLNIYLRNLQRDEVSFALYRLPLQNEPFLVIQRSQVQTYSSLISLDVSPQNGFLFAPFAITDDHPALLIAPEEVYSDTYSIARTAFKGVRADRPWIDQLDAVPLQHIQDHKDLPVFLSSDFADKQSALKRYRYCFSNFHYRVKNGDFRKLVLSRLYNVRAYEVHPVQIFARACEAYPNMLVSMVYTPISGLWLGATPELLVRGESGRYNTMSMAGTMSILDLPASIVKGDVVQDLSTFYWSDKNKEEQQIVTDYITATLARLNAKFTCSAPFTSQAGELVHLKTDFLFSLPVGTSLGVLCDALHPNPAVCGLPRREAREFITTTEYDDRSYYSGLLGPWQPTRTSHIYANLRCMQLLPSHESLVGSSLYSKAMQVSLYAGGGIMPESDAMDEFEETCNKMECMSRFLFKSPEPEESTPHSSFAAFAGQ